jgi:hypothetical protein
MPKRLTTEQLKKCGVDPAISLDKLSDDQLRGIVKVCANTDCFVETTHVQEQRAKRGIDFSQVKKCLKLGTCVEIVPGSPSGQKLRIEWCDPIDRTKIAVVAALDDSRGPAIIVTSFTINP